MSNATNNLSRFLYSFRVRRGYENISDFLDSVELPVSPNYYRDVEAGRKLPSVETASEIFKCLPFDETEDNMEFFWHYLKDLLPENIHEHLLIPRVDTSFKNLKNAQELLEYDLKMHREAAAIARFEHTYVSPDEEIVYLNERLDMLPLLHFLYMIDEASEDDIKQVCIKNGITRSDNIIDEYLTRISTHRMDDGRKIYVRKNPIFRVPRTPTGISFKDIFTKHEINRSLDLDRCPEMFSTDSTFDYSVIVALPEDRREKLTERLRDLISELSISEKQLENPTAVPFFVSVVVSGRPEYKAK